MMTLDADECMFLERASRDPNGNIGPGVVSDWRRETDIARHLIAEGFVFTVDGLYHITEDGRQALKTILG